MSNTWLKLLVLCAGLGSANAWSATQGQIDTARAKGLWWLITYQNGDGSWGKGSADIASTATGIEGFNTAGVRGPIYGRAYSWVANAPAVSVDSLARQITAVRSAGGNVDRLVADLIAARNTSFSWGSYAKYGTSHPDTALAVNALLPVSSYTTTNVGNALCQILAARRADGGWSYFQSTGFPGANSAIVPTATNLLVIAAMQTSRGFAGGTSCGGPTISTALSSGVAWLLTLRNVDNGFGAGGVSSVIETAFAYQALRQLAPSDPATGTALDYLIATQNAANGGWANNAFQTALVMRALPAPLTALLDTDKDGVPDAVELLAGTNPNVDDSRGVASGNGENVPGLTVPSVLAAEATLGQPFSFPLTATGGTPPYTWKITTGSLPPGISIGSATGLIAGTPIALGSYAFFYTVTDAAALPKTLANVVAQIDVYRSKPSLASGDINGDGNVDAIDVLLAERAALGLITLSISQKERADISPEGNPDGLIDAADVLRIRLKALGLAN